MPDPDDPEDIDHVTHKNPELMLMDAAREIAWFASKRPPEMDAIHEALLKGLYDGMRCDHVIVFGKDAESENLFKPITGMGALYEQVKDSLQVDRGGKDMLGLCLDRRMNALVYDTGETSAKAFMPKWLNDFKCNSIMVFPVWDETPDPEQEEDEDNSELSEAQLKEKALEKSINSVARMEWMMKNRLIVIHFY